MVKVKAPIVQWIEYKIADLGIEVRIFLGAPLSVPSTFNKSPRSLSEVGQRKEVRTMVLSKEAYRRMKWEKGSRSRLPARWGYAKERVRFYEEREQKRGGSLVDALPDIMAEGNPDVGALAIGRVRASHKNLSPRRREILRQAMIWVAELRLEGRSPRPAKVQFQTHI